MEEEGACRLVFKMFVTMAEGLDCTYDQWVRLFRGAVHEAGRNFKTPTVDWRRASLWPRDLDLSSLLQP